jgi:hypothetical protein
VAQTAPLVLAPHDSAMFAMKRDAIPAPTPRHGCPRAATSSCETFISLITASGRPAGHRRAWARRVGARQPDLRYYRCCPRSASTSSGLSNEPNNSTFCPEIGSGQPFSVAAGLCLRGIASALRWALRAWLLRGCARPPTESHSHSSSLQAGYTWPSSPAAVCQRSWQKQRALHGGAECRSGCSC